MNEYMKEYEDALFKAAAYEALKRKSKEYMDEVSGEPEPSELEIKRFEKLLDKRLRAKRRKQAVKNIGKVGGRVAVIIMAFVTVSFALIMTVDAAREQFTRFLMSFYPKYTEVQIQNSDKNGNIVEGDRAIQFKEFYAPTYIPDGYKISSMNLDSLDICIVYENSSGSSIRFDGMTADAVSQVDSENADKLETISISGNPGLLIEKDGWNTITWSDENYYFILTSQVDELETIKIAESVRKEE